jgi:muramidase (phage lysozyme)
VSFSPQQRALLDTIAMAEGTFAGGDPKGYRIMFGGGQMPQGSMRHPDTVVHGGRVSSAAAGRYQFMPGTWGMARQALGLKEEDFGNPAVQDKAAWYLAERRGVKADQLGDTLDPGVVHKLAPEWASFPMPSGASRYPNQSVKKLGDLQSFYTQRLNHWKQGGGQVAAAPASSPATGGPPGEPSPPPASGTGGGQTAPPAATSTPASEFDAFLTQKIDELRNSGAQLAEYNRQLRERGQQMQQQALAQRSQKVDALRQETSRFAGDEATQDALRILSEPLVAAVRSSDRDRA